MPQFTTADSTGSGPMWATRRSSALLWSKTFIYFLALKLCSTVISKSGVFVSLRAPIRDNLPRNSPKDSSRSEASRLRHISLNKGECHLLGPLLNKIENGRSHCIGKDEVSPPNNLDAQNY
ncbi:hypothetical protein GQX74_000440 [Glossina fuscipes]|nr:hypothetical protein GQX74_000440 [Glossina fuscipes]